MRICEGSFKQCKKKNMYSFTMQATNSFKSAIQSTLTIILKKIWRLWMYWKQLFQPSCLSTGYCFSHWHLNLKVATEWFSAHQQSHNVGSNDIAFPPDICFRYTLIKFCGTKKIKLSNIYKSSTPTALQNCNAAKSNANNYKVQVALS